MPFNETCRHVERLAHRRLHDKTTTQRGGTASTLKYCRSVVIMLVVVVVVIYWLFKIHFLWHYDVVMCMFVILLVLHVFVVQCGCHSCQLKATYLPTRGVATGVYRYIQCLARSYPTISPLKIFMGYFFFLLWGRTSTGWWWWWWWWSLPSDDVWAPVSLSTSCGSSCDWQGRFLQWIVDRGHHR